MRCTRASAMPVPSLLDPEDAAVQRCLVCAPHAKHISELHQAVNVHSKQNTPHTGLGAVFAGIRHCGDVDAATADLELEGGMAQEEGRAPWGAET